MGVLMAANIRDFNKTFNKMQSVCELYTGQLQEKLSWISGEIS